MAIKDSQTEKQIANAAKQLFFKEGRFKATTQEIADAAGVNRTLVNYYFRSRDLLFDQILKEARDTMNNRLNSTMEEGLSFREKIEHFIDVMIEQSINYPYMDIYMVTRMNDDVNNENGILASLKDKANSDKFKHFMKTIEEERKKGTIIDIPPFHFFLSLMSLLSYPVIAQPLFKALLQNSDKQFIQLLHARKQIILKSLFV